MKYPIGIQTFEQIVQEGYVYVDKTDLVYSLVKGGKIYFLSRPRRFGKSLLVSTLEQYFLGRKELFKGLAIDKLETEWLQYPVFHIDFNSTNFTVSGNLEKKIELLLSDWENAYGIKSALGDYGDRFSRVLKQASQQCGRRCVVLIDEYDKPLLDVFDSGIEVEIAGQKRLLEDRHREILKGFYSTFKAADAHLQFVFLTGVTKFSQVSIFSGFNQPDDISSDSRYEALCGITEAEVERCFAEPIAEMAETEGVTYEEMRRRLQSQYDGYQFSKTHLGIYNPFSLLNALAKRDIGSYWFASGTPTYLMRLLAHADDTINELVGRYYKPSEFVDYKADVDAPLPMIYQSGYLTIKEFDPLSRTYKLDFPNDEVQDGFISALVSGYFKRKNGAELGSWVQKVVSALTYGRVEELQKLFTAFLSSIPYVMRRRDDEPECERYFQYTLYLVLRIISTYTVLVEQPQSQGRVDCIVETPANVYIFEFKLDGSAKAALQQIEERGYARPYAADTRKVFKIGVNFSSKTSTIDQWEIA